MSGLPCKICHQSTAILKTFGNFSLVCGLHFVEQLFNWMILILWTLIGSKLKWSSGANNEATRRSCLAPEVACQTEWRENYTRALQKLWKHVLFSIMACFVFALFIYFHDRSESRVFTFSHFFPQNLSFPAFSIYSQSLEYELITGDHWTNQIAWNRITVGLYLIIKYIKI